MRRTAIAAAAAVLVALPVNAVVAEEAPPARGEVVQTTSGSIALPTRFTDAEGGFPGLGRRLWLINSGTNGTVMHVLDVSPESWGGSFELRGVSDRTGSGDLDVYLYEDFGDAQFPGAISVTKAEYDSGGPGETGFIPFGTRRAIVFTPNAVQATFTYEARDMPTIDLGDPAALDITVPMGAFVGWENTTDEYGFVRHVPADGEDPLFDSSPAPATGIRKGEVFSHQFAETGTYLVETSAGTGTVTVVDGPGAGTPAG